MKPLRRHPVVVLGDETDALVAVLNDSRNLKIIDKLNDYPILMWLWIYCPFRNLKVRKALMWFAPAGIVFYLLSIPYTRRLHDDIARIDTTTAALQGIIAEIVRQ